MFDAEFFPTPRDVAHKMLSKVSKDAVNFLEPSAGKGDIADVIRGHKYDGYGNGGRYGSHYESRRKVDCIERSPELCSVLSGKELSVIGYDWLDYSGVCYYDAILMNPPFSNGDDHLLKAWDFMHDGEIVCLLNEETIKNPHTAARKRLATIIEASGTVEYLGACFSTAARKTDVNVAMVYLKKVSEDDTLNMWASISEERQPDEDIGDDPNMLAIRDDLGNMQHYYDSANDHMLKAFAHLRKAQLYLAANKISATGDEYKEIAALAYKNTNAARAAWSRKHKRDAWMQVFSRMEFRKWLDKKQTDEFLRDIERSSDVPFTKENIRGTLANVFQQRGKLFHMSVANVFDTLTSHFNGNTSHTEGWKTNDSYKVNEKVIFPWGCYFDDGKGKWTGSFNLYQCRGITDVYNDLDRVLSVLDGVKFEEVLTIGRALENKFQNRSADHSAPNNKVHSTYFEIRYWKKGTVHLIWKDKELWEKFNKAAAKGKNWIGTSTQGEGGKPAEPKQHPGTWNSTEKKEDPEAEIRKIYTARGIPKETQDAMLAEIKSRSESAAQMSLAIV